MPELRRMQEETADGVSLFGRELTVNEIITEIRQGTATNFGKIVSHSGIGQSVGTAKITKIY